MDAQDFTDVLKAVRAFVREPQEAQRFESANEELTQLALAATLSSSRSSTASSHPVYAR